jgi:hypothetical protein
MKEIIKITRLNGKSNAEVIIELVRDTQPGTTFSFDQLRSQLEAGTDQKYSNTSVCGIIRMANVTLLRLHCRELRNVRKVGFVLIPAREHMAVARLRRTKADKQIRRAFLSLQCVRWNEMDSNTRQAHEGQLMLTSAIMEQIRIQGRRQAEYENLVNQKLSNVDERLKGAGL